MMLMSSLGASSPRAQKKLLCSRAFFRTTSQQNIFYPSFNVTPCDLICCIPFSSLKKEKMLIQFGPAHLPVELINAILSFLLPWDLSSISQVNKPLHQLADADKLWKPLLSILPSRVGLKKGARRQQKERMKLSYKKRFEKEYLAARLRWARAKLHPTAMCIHPPHMFVLQETNVPLVR
jgi:hypothetical protein